MSPNPFMIMALWAVYLIVAVLTMHNWYGIGKQTPTQLNGLAFGMIIATGLFGSLGMLVITHSTQVISLIILSFSFWSMAMPAKKVVNRVP